MDTVSNAVHYVFLATAVCFVLGLHLMNHPRTARRGNALSAGGMAVAIAATVWLVIHEGTITTTGSGSCSLQAASSVPRWACTPPARSG
ncbi:NAD(P)(+) transhydrogenase (Re/Si-specific) subunit beta [Streptomyces sp. NPDC048341]|uniref:NAD(P)(+) transhydrogenase (Re/Si-specific) subunit beta n=1 Tax=Streptomyces sp. NPDC048341 TaxID=3154620 RepID=UPI00343F6F6C